MECLMRHVLHATLALVLLGALVAGANARTRPSAEPTVGCDRIVLRAWSGAADGSRVLLGAVSVPGAVTSTTARRPHTTRIGATTATPGSPFAPAPRW